MILSQKSFDPVQTNIRPILNVMLPKSQYRVTFTSQLSCNPPVTPHIVFYLVPPVLLCRPLLFVVVVSVPEYTITENSHPLPNQKVWIPVHLRMLFKLYPVLSQNAFHFVLNLGVLAPDAGHDPRPLLLCEDVCHVVKCIMDYFPFACCRISKKDTTRCLKKNS